MAIILLGLGAIAGKTFYDAEKDLHDFQFKLANSQKDFEAAQRDLQLQQGRITQLSVSISSAHDASALVNLQNTVTGLVKDLTEARKDLTDTRKELATYRSTQKSAVSITHNSTTVTPKDP